MYLPPYSPDLRPVERLWIWLRQTLGYLHCHADEAELQERIAAAGIPSLDLLPVVLREQRIQGLYLSGDGHFTVRGHRVAARAVAQWILDEGLLTPAPTSASPR